MEIGASVASRKQRGGMALPLAVGVCICAIFVLVSKFALIFSINLNMPLMLSMWSTNIGFGILIGYLVSTAQKYFNCAGYFCSAQHTSPMVDQWILKILLSPLALLYGLVIAIRNGLYSL